MNCYPCHKTRHFFWQSQKTNTSGYKTRTSLSSQVVVCFAPRLNVSAAYPWETHEYASVLELVICHLSATVKFLTGQVLPLLSQDYEDRSNSVHELVLTEH